MNLGVDSSTRRHRGLRDRAVRSADEAHLRGCEPPQIVDGGVRAEDEGTDRAESAVDHDAYPAAPNLHGDVVPITRWETGSSQPSLDALVKLGGLRTSTDDLLFGQDDHGPDA